MENVLKKIIEKKKISIARYKKDYSENYLLNNISTTLGFFDFTKKMKLRYEENKLSIIAEIKKASPSAGLLVEKFDCIDIAKTYSENGVSFLSVLTEEDFFLGKLDFIKNIKKNVKIPILCKDFFIDTYQIPLAKSYGADCILIILSAVDKELAKDLYQTALNLKMSVLIEVHTEKECEFALSFEDSMIGINNRNLKTLDISLDTSVKLYKLLKDHKNPLISESGIHSSNEIKFITENTKIKSFLIGESLLTSEDIPSKLRDLIK